MPASRHSVFRRRLLLALALVAGAAWGDGDATWTVEALMAERAQVQAASASFVERKYLRMLMQRLESRGTLRYVAPDWMIKTTTAPVNETFEVHGDTVASVQRDGQRYSASLRDHPEIAGLVEGMRSTLAGDLATLQRHYTLQLQGSRAAWQLRLVPTNPRVGDKVSNILISGAQAALTRVDVHERDGDRSEMIILPEQP